MIDELIAAAYWGPREETLDRCSERLMGFLEQIGRITPHFSQWYEQGRTKRGAMRKPIAIEADRIRGLLEKGRSRDDTPQRRVIESLGFLVGMWTGDRPDGSSVSLIANCGSHDRQDDVNSVILRYPPVDWLDVEQAVALVRAMVSCWSPAHAAVCSPEALSAVGGQAEIPIVDWVFFHRRARTGPPAAPSRVAFELDGGECVVVQDTPVRRDRVDERARARALAKQLGLA